MREPTEPTEPTHFCLSIRICAHKNHDGSNHCQQENAQNGTEQVRKNAQHGTQLCTLLCELRTSLQPAPRLILFNLKSIFWSVRMYRNAKVFCAVGTAGYGMGNMLKIVDWGRFRSMTESNTTRDRLNSTVCYVPEANIDNILGGYICDCFR
ncbi:hypothetical protein ECA2755 [Pectobacterium atrosepticum SCRI1043]|uniref:Uncharacterized protein n=1 Tax=Pectobacterium atrosepticum (strain SCRI 1043 / ATCC BAA-672) TaxID=218491 RepID=Q6D3I9_PECAS|nr:hypothetical protein ECA2755 [Pectobacterium atrosepticum SCRI1043]